MARRLPPLAGVLLLGALLSPATAPTAGARVGVAPGMEIVLDGGASCTLGFLAGNNAGDRLAVTAGHCAKAAGEVVYNRQGYEIGQVVAHESDGRTVDGGFGITLIALADDVEIPDGFFTHWATPTTGAVVHKYGNITQDTEGTVTTVTVDAEYPRYSVMRSSLTADHGDSGAPWYGDSQDGPVLYGITIGSFTSADDASIHGVYGFPIGPLVDYVRESANRWGAGFTPAGH
ncbi:MAG: hypothetical protein H6523_11325 [Mycolicibacterium sp.]|jgi:hypothetical protein|nr:hypothetical protein [Mycolicibacterium sp.]